MQETYKVPVYRVALVREGEQRFDGPFQNSRQVFELLRRYLDGSDRENFVVLLLNGKNKLIGINTVSIGSLTASLVHPREVYKPAILANAAALIFAHNHPSGDSEPSVEDRTITKRLTECGALLGIRVLDHIVLGDGCYFSFLDRGELAR